MISRVFVIGFFSSVNRCPAFEILKLGFPRKQFDFLIDLRDYRFFADCLFLLRRRVFLTNYLINKDYFYIFDLSCKVGLCAEHTCLDSSLTPVYGQQFHGFCTSVLSR